MKPKFHSTLLLGICLILSNMFVNGQDNKLRVHAISIGAGVASTTSGGAETGLGLDFDFATIVKNHLISININTGSDIRTTEGKELFLELNLTYGRKWEIGQFLKFEAHVGAGLFTYDLDTGPSIFGLDFPDATIGFPFRVKLIYYPIEKFGIGLNPNINFNSITTAYNANIILQYNFN